MCNLCLVLRFFNLLHISLIHFFAKIIFFWQIRVVLNYWVFRANSDLICCDVLCVMVYLWRYWCSDVVESPKRLEIHCWSQWNLEPKSKVAYLKCLLLQSFYYSHLVLTWLLMLMTIEIVCQMPMQHQMKRKEMKPFELNVKHWTNLVSKIEHTRHREIRQETVKEKKPSI